MGENSSKNTDLPFLNSTIEPQFVSKLSPTADLAIAAFLIFAGLSSVCGNGMVLAVYYRKRNKIKPAELMTVNLALCDLGFSVLGMPFFIVSSFSHAWVFGETGCVWYGILGSVFGIGSLITTSLISLDRCLKICCLRYGQWISNLHAFMCVAVIWLYTVLWASLPAFGFGSYRPEPYGTSCTVDWWSIQTSHRNRLYIYFFLSFGFGLPTLTIISSYMAILLKVHTSNRALASIPCSTVSNTSSKDVKLAKMAVVVCAAFLVAWLPYASVSLISALLSRDNQFPSTAPPFSIILPPVQNFTTSDSLKPNLYPGSEGQWTNTSLSSQLGSHFRNQESILSPVVTLIPAMFAKSHCMINPVIYQIMHREFRDSLYEMVFGRVKADRRRHKRKNSSVQVKLSFTSRRTSCEFH